MKEKNASPSCKIHDRVCSWKENYIDETKLNVTYYLFDDHENSNKYSEPKQHLRHHPDDIFQWKVLMSAPMNNSQRKNLEAFFIAVEHATLSGTCHNRFK